VGGAGGPPPGAAGGAATPIAGAGDGGQQGHNGVDARFSDHGLSATLLFAGATPTPSEEYVEKEEREEGDGELIFTFASSSRWDAAAAGCVWAWVRRGSGGGGGRGAGGQGGGRGARVGARRETVSPWTVLSMFLHLPELDRRLRGSTETIRLELDRAYPPPRLRADRGRRAAVDQAVVEARAQAGDAEKTTATDTALEAFKQRREMVMVIQLLHALLVIQPS
ncbi:hypothetical protein EJB05_34658, partial [Eragrostis curvula]